jgi:secreted trypsin-like serine protease
VLVLLLGGAPAGAQVSTRVVPGADAGDGDYPWTVALVRAGQTAYAGRFCGGALVRPDIVITSAHCVAAEALGRPSDLTVAFGVTRLSDADDDPESYRAGEAIAILPQADGPGWHISYDLAMVRLASSTGLPESELLPVTTPAEFDALPPTTDLHVVGWGRTTAAANISADRLRWGVVQRWADGECQAAWPTRFRTEDQFCALGRPTFADTCQGDSGGPIMKPGPSTQDSKGWLLLGTVSYGSASCTEADRPAAYSRIAAPGIADWAARAADDDPANDPPTVPRAQDGVPLGAPTIAQPVEGEPTACGVGTFAFDDGDPERELPTAVDFTILRLEDPLVTTVGPAPYTPTAADVGKTFFCRATGRTVGGGGSVGATSAASAPTRAAPVPAPPPVATTPAPAPIAAPAAVDRTAPTITSVRRSCTTSRRCVFTIRPRDRGGSAGVMRITASLSRKVTRTCRRNGRRTRCTTTVTKRLAAIRRGDGTYRAVVPGRLAKGRYTLALLAIDAAGNIQRTATKVAFRLT